ncbi:MAG: phosphohistidine swiveling domain-containing protein [Hyphomicrobiaceae bacterium]|jgi:phosphohistidine swiveling domain-containing protein
MPDGDLDLPAVPQSTPLSLPLNEIADHEVGGKAAGLAELLAMGLSVPPAFVIINAQADLLPEDVLQRYAAIGGGKVAVRSSAIGEDGEESSFAGLYETILNVEGETALKQAIVDCIGSLHSARADAYNADQAHLHGATMCVVVQKMVPAACAGVLFSADPVSGRHDRLIIDAVRGLGEALVSGEETPDHYELDLDDQVVRSELVGSAAILTPENITALANGARQAVESQGAHLDMEWAFDEQGQLHWLQARPITTLGCDLNDGCTPIPADHVITRCNVGEMLPGPVCPLTFSTQGRAIEKGMQHMHVCYAGRPAINEEWTQINLFYGHMFINLSGGLASSRYVSLTNAELLAQTLCGRVIPELLDPTDKKPLPRRWWGSLRFVQYCLRATRVIAEFNSRFQNYHLRVTNDSASMAIALEATFNWLLETDEVHLRSSAYSGLMEGIIQGIVSGRDKEATPEQAAQLQGEAARLLAGAANVESAVMVEQLDAVVDLIARDQLEATQFRAYTPTQALHWLQSDKAGEAAQAFAGFLERHGHRGYRELCVREKAWRENPEQVVMTMQASIAARLQGNYQPRSSPAVDLSLLSLPLRWLLPAAHNAIRQREQTKSILVQATYSLKRGYRHLGQLLVREGKLPDADLLYFMSREELAAFCKRPDPKMVELCGKRRRAFAFQQKLEFDDVHVGFAHPVEHQQVIAGENELIGRPVSRGVVEGKARVATTLEQAADLQPGEILVSHITDIGWTPYFSLIAGLATDVGSAVSHGAVIAREYGLPAIVNLRVATKVIKTGDTIRLDADRGILTRL